MSERASFDAAVPSEDELDGHADALLDSLFDDPWQIESDTANRDSTPTPREGVAGAQVPSANRTAQPPAVNPAGPVRREPFARSPNAPAISSRRPRVVAGAQRPLQPVPVADAVFYSEANLKVVGLTPLPVPVEPSPLQAARVAIPKPAVEWRTINQPAPASHGRDSLDWLEQSRLPSDRARWLQAEAERHADPERKGKLLLTCSELWALAGNPDAAIQAARAATALLPTSAVAHRQLRQLSLHAGDTATALTALDVEMRHSTEEMHAHLLGMQAALAGHSNPVVFMNALTDLARCAPRDPRPALYRLAAQLAASAAPPELIGVEDLPPGIAQAVEETLQYRGASGGLPRATPNANTGAAPSLSFEQARRALRRRDAPALVQALSRLAQVPPLWEPAHWLIAALLDGPANDRTGSSNALLELHRRDPQGPATRALARSLLELGQQADLCALLERSAASFTPLERVCLHLLAAPDAPIRGEWLEQATASSQPATMDAFAAVLGVATTHAFLPRTSPLWKLVTGRALAREPFAALELLDTGNREPFSLLLGMQHALEQGRHDKLIQGFIDWSQYPGYEGLRIAAALWSDLQGEPNQAQHLWLDILAKDPSSELAFRAANEHGAELQPLDLEAMARNHRSPDRSALLLLEAAHQLRASAPQECARLLSSAVERAPKLPFAYQWANELAQQQQDPSSSLDWLERRRTALPDPSSWATPTLRTALQLLDQDRAQAAQLIAEVAAAFPRDLSLQQLGESLVGNAWGDWRASFTQHLEEPSERAHWLLALALQGQRSDLSRATQLSADAEQTNSTPLGQWLNKHWSDQLAAQDWRQTLANDLLKCSDEPVALELAQRCAEMADHWQDIAAAKAAWAAVLRCDPKSLPALRGLEHSQVDAHALSELQTTEASLSVLLNDQDAAPHAQIQLLLAGHDEAAPQVLDRMLSAEPVPLTALRTALSQAWLEKDAPRELELTLHLLDRCGSEEDHAALALRGAHLAVQLDDLALAETLLDRTLNIAPNHAAALATQAQLCLCLDQWPRLAQTLSAFAAASHVTSHRAEALHQAALIWLDRLGDGERGEAALEAAAHLAPNDDDLAERLQRHYLETEQRVKLLEQIEHRLNHTRDVDLKQQLVALRDRTLQEVGATPRPRPVSQHLDASPEHHDALDAYARRSFAGGEIKAAEGAWLQLARIVQDPVKQADYYRSLAELYCKGDFNLARAAVCYSEVRKRLPNDLQTVEKLIGLYERLQRPAEAIELQNELLRGARDDSERRRWTLRLAALHEARDPQQAELLLQQARKSWPYQAEVLHALARLYQKNGQTAALQGLLERASKEAKNELLGGSFELKPFDILRACAELADDLDAVHVVRGTQVALGNVQDIVLGKDRLVTGIGAKASAARADKLLVPEALSPALRTLLEDAGPALDRATRQDLVTLAAMPLAQRDAALLAYCQDVARAVGLSNVDFQVSTQLGAEIVAWSSATPCLVLGQALVVSGDRPLLTHFLYRALKIVSAHAAALLRGTPADAQLRLCALLCALIPDWQPPGLDRSLVEPVSNRIRNELSASTRKRLEPLAQEIVAVFGARTAHVSVLIERWTQRSALLACGDMSVALRAIAALTSKEAPLPDEPAARLRWVAKNPLARDLVLFSVSDEYFAARRE